MSFQRRHPVAFHHGRPSDFREEYCAEVEKFMAQGKSIVAFAGHIGVTAHTIYEWQKRHGTFAHSVAVGECARAGWWEERLASSEKGGQSMASIFALKNVQPTMWTDRREINQTVNVKVKAVSDADLLRLAGVQTIEHEPAHTEPTPIAKPDTSD